MTALAITRADIWEIVLLALMIILILRIRKFNWPDPATVQSYATIANTPGGLIFILLTLFGSVFLSTTLFCVWVLVRGIDPQNGIVILLTGLFSGAIGAVSGALFTAMKGQEPHPPVTSSTVTVSKTEEKQEQPPANQ